MRGCRRAALMHDGEIYGKGMAVLARGTARRIGLKVVAFRTDRAVRRREPPARAAAARPPRGLRRLRRHHRQRRRRPMFRAVGRRLPRAQLFGTDGIAESGFTGRLPARVARRVLLMVSTLAPSAYPQQGQDFFARYAARYGDGSPDPFAVYGYEAMRLVLDAVAAAGPDRRAVVDALRAMPARDGAIGRYAFDRRGDTTLRTLGTYRIQRGRLVWAGAIQAP